MTTIDRFEAQVERWLAETAEPRIPDDFPILLAQTARMRQRPAWRFPERWLPMSSLTLRRSSARTVPWRAVAVSLALVALLIIAFAVVVGGSRRSLPPPYGLARNGFLVFSAGGDLIALDPSTGARRTLVGGPADDDRPVFSRDGTRIAFKRVTPDGISVAVVDADGSHLIILPVDVVDTTDRLEWSPDGRSLLVSAESDALVPDPRMGPARSMAIVPTDGSGAARTLDVGMTAEMATWRPPDGDEILFRGRTGDGHALFVIDADGTDGAAAHRITPISSGPFAYDLRIGWSPDGRHVVFQREPDGVIGMEIWTADADGAHEQRLTPHYGLAPTWSPDGTTIAYHSADDVWQLAVARIGDPTSERRMGATLDSGFTYTWTPDGRHIVQSAVGLPFLSVFDARTGEAANTSWQASRAPTYQRLPFEP